MEFDVKFSESNQTFDVSFSEVEGSFDAEFGEIMVVSDAPVYTGQYDVTPKINKQTLETEGKLMSKNVEVNGIPYFKVSNNSGGNTIYIAKEV